MKLRNQDTNQSFTGRSERGLITVFNVFQHKKDTRNSQD